MQADLQAQVFEEVNARKYSDNNYNSKTSGTEAVIIPMLPICLDVDRVRKMPTPKGQKGDPAVVGNGDEKPVNKSKNGKEYSYIPSGY